MRGTPAKRTVKIQSQRKGNVRPLKGGICKPRSNHYGRPLPHLVTSKVVIKVVAESIIEEYMICSWCGGRKKSK